MPRAELVAILCAGCAAAPDRPPVARITATPTAILVHDDFQTDVVLDGSTSAVLDEPGAVLDYAWQILDDEYRTDQDLRGPMLTVRFRGDTPPRVVLRVATADGLADSVTRPIALTLP